MRFPQETHPAYALAHQLGQVQGPVPTPRGQSLELSFRVWTNMFPEQPVILVCHNYPHCELRVLSGLFVPPLCFAYLLARTFRFDPERAQPDCWGQFRHPRKADASLYRVQKFFAPTMRLPELRSLIEELLLDVILVQEEAERIVRLLPDSAFH